jgi:uncharacterized membrane protein YtjA (UPF0391 family)
MLRWALIFLVVAIVAAIFGFGGIAGEAAWVAKVLLVVFVILAIVSLVMGRRGVSISQKVGQNIGPDEDRRALPRDADLQREMMVEGESELEVTISFWLWGRASAIGRDGHDSSCR